MNCLCSICCSRLESSDDIFTTNCGHIFHFPCLTQWLERSKTCPQCREKTSASKIHRLYFNVSNNDTIKEDSASLQERIDNLQFQILIRDKDVNDFKAKAAKLQTQMSLLRSEVLKLEAEIEHKNSAIHALKEQAKYYKQTHDEGEKYKNEAEILRNKLNNFKDVQTLLISTNDEADALVSSTEDPNKLATYITALKRELTVGLNNRKEYRLMIKRLRQDLNKCILENNHLKETVKKMRCVEEAMQQLDIENKMLMKKLDEHNKVENCSEMNLNETEKVESIKLANENIYSSTLMIDVKAHRELNEDSVDNSLQNLRYKVKNLVSDNKRKMTRVNSGNAVSSNSILAKKPRLARSSMISTGKSHDGTYASDGLGGFAKVEQFPTATGGIKKRIQSNKSRATQLNDANNQNKIDNFVDLT